MKLVALCLLLVASCCSRKTCPTIPVRPATDAPVVVVAKPLPCNLPALPEPVTFDAMPSGDRLLVTRTSVEATILYLRASDDWMRAAALCLAGQR